jgi:hypothetical protein
MKQCSFFCVGVELNGCHRLAAKIRDENFLDSPISDDFQEAQQSVDVAVTVADKAN